MTDVEREIVYTKSAFPKTCSCCQKIHSQEDWAMLQFLGIQKGTDISGKRYGPDLDLRLCSCGTTMSVDLVDC